MTIISATERTARTLFPIEESLCVLAPTLGAPDTAETYLDTLYGYMYQLLADQAEGDWDLPARAWAIARFTDLPHRLRKDIRRRALKAHLATDLEQTAVVFDLELPDDGEGTAPELLAACRIPSWVHGVYFYSEAWARRWKPDILEPTAASEHRVELRCLSMTLDDGTFFHIGQRRGETPQLVAAGDASQTWFGAAVDAQQRLLGTSTAPSKLTVDNFRAGCAFAAMLEWAEVTDHPLGSAVLTRHLASAGSNGADRPEPEAVFDLMVRLGARHVGESLRVLGDNPTWEDIRNALPSCAHMDEPMTARAVMATLPSAAELVDRFETCFGPEDAALVRSTLGAAGWLDWVMPGGDYCF